MFCLNKLAMLDKKPIPGNIIVSKPPKAAA